MKVDTARVLERRRAERDALLARGAAFAADLPGSLDVQAVVVFGSVARGDFNKWSDVDVLVVAEQVADDPLERQRAVEPAPGRVQPVLWTPQEYRRRRRQRDPIALETWSKGVWLRGSRHDPELRAPSS
ncbi:MAG: nucleotidyltransferase domain-containing protein [Actinobacteria bacterium]|nr:nucleotidyltransferase domain-containing protein [Actinomycetota bacterium]